MSTNDASTQELSYEFGAISAEVAGGGVRVNIIPREGGNQFSGLAFFNFANDGLQGNNVDDELRSQGIDDGRQHQEHLRHQLRDRRPAQARQAVVLDGATGSGATSRSAPIRSTRATRTTSSSIRTRSRPGTETQENGSLDLRLTWQISPKNKISGYYNYAPREHQPLDAGQHHPARRLEPAEPAGEPLRDADVPLDDQLAACCSKPRPAT